MDAKNDSIKYHEIKRRQIYTGPKIEATSPAPLLPLQSYAYKSSKKLCSTLSQEIFLSRLKWHEVCNVPAGLWGVGSYHKQFFMYNEDEYQGPLTICGEPTTEIRFYYGKIEMNSQQIAHQ